MNPKRTKYSRAEAPLHTIRVRDAGNGQSVRMVKIRMDGPSGKRWLHFAKWWWLQNRGPIPAGKRICHADGDLLNDDPGNFVALSPGEVFNLYHKLDPEMSRRNHAACGKSAAARNVETGRLRRSTSWLCGQWYGVDFPRRLIYNQPRRKRWMIYRDHGFAGHLRESIERRLPLAKTGDTFSAQYVLGQIEAMSNWHA